MRPAFSVEAREASRLCLLAELPADLLSQVLAHCVDPKDGDSWKTLVRLERTRRFFYAVLTSPGDSGRIINPWKFLEGGNSKAEFLDKRGADFPRWVQQKRIQGLQAELCNASMVKLAPKRKAGLFEIRNLSQDQRIICIGPDLAGKSTIAHKLRLGPVLSATITIGFNTETISVQDPASQYCTVFTAWDINQGSENLLFSSLPY